MDDAVRGGTLRVRTVKKPRERREKGDERRRKRTMVSFRGTNGGEKSEKGGESMAL